MFSLGFFGLFLITAIPLFAGYTLAVVFIAITVAGVNKFSSSVNFDVSAFQLIEHALVAWIAGVVLFFLLGYANHRWPQYSGNALFRLYPLALHLSGFLIFLHLLLPAVSSKDPGILLPKWQRNSYSIAIALLPIFVLFIAANIRGLTRVHP